MGWFRETLLLKVHFLIEKTFCKDIKKRQRGKPWKYLHSLYFRRSWDSTIHCNNLLVSFSILSSNRIFPGIAFLWNFKKYNNLIHSQFFQQKYHILVIVFYQWDISIYGQCMRKFSEADWISIYFRICFHPSWLTCRNKQCQVRETILQICKLKLWLLNYIAKNSLEVNEVHLFLRCLFSGATS